MSDAEIDPEKREKLLKYYTEKFAREQAQLSVIYECACGVEHFVVLDRYPMSQKIMTGCCPCKENNIVSLSRPIRFHLPLTDKDYSLDDLRQMYITDSEQKWLIEAYINQKELLQ